MRTRDRDWGDPQTGERAYGVQVLVNGEWRNDADETGAPRLYRTLEARAKRRAELRKAKPEDGRVGQRADASRPSPLLTKARGL